MGLEDFDNPYRAPEVFPERAVEPEIRRRYRWVRLWIVFQMVVAIVGCAAAFYDVETIVATGPTLTVVGIFGIITCIRRRFLFGFWISMSAPAISLGVFLLIFLCNWSPTYAQGPVPIIGAIYTVALCVMGFIAWRRTWLLQSKFDASDVESSVQQSAL